MHGQKNIKLCRRRFCACCVYIPTYFVYPTSFFYSSGWARTKKKAFDFAPVVELFRVPIILGHSETEIAVSNLAEGTDVSPHFCSVRVDDNGLYFHRRALQFFM